MKKQTQVRITLSVFLIYWIVILIRDIVHITKLEFWTFGFLAVFAQHWIYAAVSGGEIFIPGASYSRIGKNKTIKIVFALLAICILVTLFLGQHW